MEIWSLSGRLPENGTGMDDNWLHLGKKAGYFLNSLVSTQTLLRHYSLWRSMRSTSFGFGTNDGPEQPCDHVGFLFKLEGEFEGTLQVVYTMY